MKTEEDFFNGVFSHLEAMPYANGYYHPCEDAIQKYLDINKSLLFKQMLNYTNSDYLLLEFVHCLKSLNLKEYANDVYEVSKIFVNSDSHYLRAAALELLERVRGKRAVEILKSYSDPLKLLNKYREQLIKQMEREYA